MGDSKPPFHYLRTCSPTSLEAFELSRYNRVANLRKEFRDLVEQWIEAEVDLRVAHWIREQRRSELSNKTAIAVFVPGLSKLLSADILSRLLLHRVVLPPSHPPLEQFGIPMLRAADRGGQVFWQVANHLTLLCSRDSKVAGRSSTVAEQRKRFRPTVRPFVEDRDSQLVWKDHLSRVWKRKQPIAVFSESIPENPRHRNGLEEPLLTCITIFSLQRCDLRFELPFVLPVLAQQPLPRPRVSITSARSLIVTRCPRTYLAFSTAT